MSAENLKLNQLNTPEIFFNPCLSLVGINHGVSNYSAGVINNRIPPNCISEIPILYSTEPSQPVIQFIINKTIANFEDCEARQAVVLLFHHASRFAGKHASLSYPKDMGIPHALPLLLRNWHNLNAGEIKYHSKTLYTFG